MTSEPERNSAQFEWVSIDVLKPCKRKVRHHNRHQRRKIAKLLEITGGQITPIIVTSDYEIIDGHALYEQLKENGASKVYVAVLQTPTASEIRALRLLINRLPADTRWDKTNLRLEFEELIELSYDLDNTGFDTAEIEAILDINFSTSGSIEDADLIPGKQDRAVSRLHDVWQLGDAHRLGCGDARNLPFIQQVCDGRLVDVCAIDPPYNLRIGNFVSGKGRNRHREFIQGAGELPENEFFSLLRDSLACLKASSSERALIYAFMDWRHILHLTSAGRALGLDLINIAVWVKSNGGMGSLYRNQHELCGIFKCGNESHRNNVELGRFGRSRTNVWHVAGMSSFGKDRDDLLRLHPTVKPTALISDILRDVTTRGECVLDTFCGSGSTIIAAEETSRRCFGVELDPLYVDVAIRRWQRLTGQDAVHTITGELFDDRAQRSVAPLPEASDGK